MNQRSQGLLFLLQPPSKRTPGTSEAEGTATTVSTQQEGCPLFQRGPLSDGRVLQAPALPRTGRPSSGLRKGVLQHRPHATSPGNAGSTAPGGALNVSLKHSPVTAQQPQCGLGSDPRPSPDGRGKCVPYVGTSEGSQAPRPTTAHTFGCTQPQTPVHVCAVGDHGAAHTRGTPVWMPSHKGVRPQPPE